MTWTKLGDEFSDECANADLSDAAYRTHVEAIGWIYRVERMDCKVPKRLIRRFAGSDRYEDGIKALLAIGWWKEHEGHYEVLHHADVIRQSIAAQRRQRDGNRTRKQRQRERDREVSVTDDVTRDVTADADRQTDRQLREAPLRNVTWPEKVKEVPA